jgi:aspartate/methionine/tyrosine aminotransferase
LLADPGDAWLVPAPGYPLLDYLAALSGVRLRATRWHTTARGIDVDSAALDALAGAEPRARAVVCTAPGNPTGAYLAESELAELEALCAGAGTALIVDEVSPSALGPAPAGRSASARAPASRPRSRACRSSRSCRS